MMATALQMTGKTTFERFCEYHAQHPDVFWKFREYAYAMKRAGFSKYGSRAILERVRWHFAIKQGPQDVFKLNDHFTPHYARLLMQHEPNIFDGFFETRAIRSP